MKTWVVMLCVLLLAASAAFAQPTSQQTGDPNYRWQRTGMPSVLRLGLNDATYPFDATQARIPFRIEGVPDAIVWMAVYSKDANPQYVDESGNPIRMGAGGPKGAVVRAAGIDTLIYVSQGQTFPEGDNMFLWDGKDWAGKAVPAGNYTIYLFAFNESLDPTVVGVGPSQPIWNNIEINFDVTPPEVWTIRESEALVAKTIYGTDVITNPDAFEAYDVSWVSPYAEPGVGKQFLFYGMKLDPDDPTLMYLIRADKMGDGDPMGFWRAIYTGDAIVPDEGWADAGFVDGGVWNDVGFGGMGLAVKHEKWHPWVEDDGLIWMMWYGRGDDPNTTQAKGYDRATGDLTTVVDMTSYYLQVIDGELRVRTGLALDLDEDGVYTAGSWSKHDNPDAVAPSHWTYDSEILWVNKNGDRFLDRVTDELAAATGEPVAIPYVANMSAGKYNMSYWTGMDMQYLAAVMGPDGSGLFTIPSTKAVFSLYGDGWHQWTGVETPYDGYYTADQNSDAVVQYPYDVQMATLRTGATYVQEIEAERKPTAFDLKANYPNPFNASTVIRFEIPEGVEGVRTTLKVYNMAGQEIVTLADDVLHAGTFEATWDGKDAQGSVVSSGTYLYTLKVGNWSKTQQMTLLK